MVICRALIVKYKRKCYLCNLNADFKMRLKIFLIILLCGATRIAQAQHSRGKSYRHKVYRDTTIIAAYRDSLALYKQRIDSVCRVNDSLMSKPQADARFFRLFAPLTFYYSVAGNSLKLSGSERQDDVNTAIDNALLNAYITHPELVARSEKRLNKAGQLHEDIKAPIRHKVDLTERTAPVPDAKPDFPLDIVIKKPNFWTFSGDYYLQFLQNYVSSNWYKGGESNYSMVASAVMQANYNNKQKVKFENKLEMKLGLQTSRGDSLHNLKTSEDLFRYTGKLGLQASKRWYYTLQLIAYTQFMRGYKSNDATVYSDLLSPFNVNLSVGMSYTVDALNGKLKGSVQLAPFAYNFRYVGRKELATRYGLDEGKHIMNDFGSECTIDLTWKISDMIKWKTRLYGYTTYKRTEMEWENTISFSFNKYISSNLFIYPRFDDGASTRDDRHGYWQFKEYASLGFAYSF